jgi:hypothetical protein
MTTPTTLEAMFFGDWAIVAAPNEGRALTHRGKEIALLGGGDGAYDIAVTSAADMMAVMAFLSTAGAAALREPEVEGQGLPNRREFVMGLFTVAISLGAPGCAGFDKGVFYFDETGVIGQKHRSGTTTTSSAEVTRKILRMTDAPKVPESVQIAAKGSGTPSERANKVVEELEKEKWTPLDRTDIRNAPRPADWAMQDEKALEPAIRKFLANPTSTDHDALGPLNVRFATEQQANLTDAERADVMLDYQLLAQSTRLKPGAEMHELLRWNALVNLALKRGALSDVEAVRLCAMGAAWSGLSSDALDTSLLGYEDRRFVGALRVVQLVRTGKARSDELEAALALVATL